MFLHVLESWQVFVPLFIAVSLTFFLFFLRPRKGQMPLPTRTLRFFDGESFGSKERVSKADFIVEMSIGWRSQATGLMFRTRLAEDRGMYFPMRWRGVWPMTMRNTTIPLDIVFIDRGVVSAILPGVPLSKKSVGYKVKCDAVLELRQGACAGRGINVGDRVSF